MSIKPIVLIILDGYGIAPASDGNAITLANTPVMDNLMHTCPFVKVSSSGLRVGLPDGQMGNSEVGHLNIGSGRVVYQDLVRITKTIEDGSFYKNNELLRACDNVKINNSALHLFGLVSSGGVHSHNSHLYSLLKLAKREHIKNVFIHCFLDGRDTPQKSGIDYIRELQNKILQIGVGKIASIHGRYYAMDRDNRWSRIEKSYNALTRGEGILEHNAISAIKNFYDNGVTDEFVMPIVIIDDNNNPIAKIKENDSIIFFNFRSDRAREITKTFCCDNFSGFNRGKRINTTYVCFTDYDITIHNKYVAFKKEKIKNTFGEWLSCKGFNQVRIAETEKYAHVTFFFNGGIEKPNKYEDRILIKSPKVPTYDLIPEMSAFEVCNNIINVVKLCKYDVVIANFANPDMVGHTGVISAEIKAIEFVDKCIGKIVDAVKYVGGQMIIVADHGNAEKMIDESGNIFTAHSTNPVPLILVNSCSSWKLKEDGALCDIAPTLIDIMGMEKCYDMTGQSLLIK